MLKSIHPITRVFWIALVVSVVVYQLNKTEYPGSDAVMESMESSSYEDMNPCVLPVIFFEGESNQLDEQAKEDLAEIAENLIQYPEMRLEIVGTQGKSESKGMAHQREKTIIKHLVKNYDISLSRLLAQDQDPESLVSPSSPQQHSSHSKNHFNHPGKKSCNTSRSYSYNYSYNYNAGNKSFKHCNSQRYTCHKNKVEKENRAVYITCMN